MHFDDYADAETEHRDYEHGVAFGDARRCPRHPSVKTSSDDGMFDCECHLCEAESEKAYHEHLEAEDAKKYPGGRCVFESAYDVQCTTAPDADADIPF